MDPLVKFLEEDEDETMHSGADVDALTAELNRDIEGNNSALEQSLEVNNDTAVLSQGSGQSTSQFLPLWQTSRDDGGTNFYSNENVMATEEKNQQFSQTDLQQDVSESEHRKESLPHDHSIHTAPRMPDEQKEFTVSQAMDGAQGSSQPLVHMQEPDSEQNLEQESLMHPLQNAVPVGVASNDQQSFSSGQGSQQTSTMGIGNEQVIPMVNRHASGVGMSSSQQPVKTSNQQSVSTMRLNKQVPFGMLLPIIQPQLDKDKAMQLQTLYIKLKKNEISKDGFVRNMRSIVGDQMLKMAVYKLQTQASRDSQTASNQFQASSRQIQISPTQIPAADGLGQPDSKIAQASQIPSSNSVAFGQDRRHPAFPTQGHTKQQQTNFSHASHTQYGAPGSGHSPFLPDNASSPSLRTVSYDSQIKPTSHAGNSLGPTNQDVSMMAMPNWALSDPKKAQGLSMTQTSNNIAGQQNQIHRTSSIGRTGVLSSLGHVKPEPFDQANDAFDTQSSRMVLPTPTSLMPATSSQVDNSTLSNSRISSLSSPIGSGNGTKVTPKKPVVGQKKPMETPVSSPPSSKKQKVSVGFQDQSIEQLNDVTAVSGVNLREEEEQLFSLSKEDGRVSEASRRVVQEEEDRLILQKIPLQKKLVEILAKCGLKSSASDLERCLSLCVEERLRALISNAIRYSKQRLDMEKSKHKIIVTSDVRRQIQTINRKAREELEKKQAETSQKSNELDSASGLDGDKDKDENRARAAKANKEEDDKMRATAANVAVRAATGGGDMLSRWQLMIEAKQKHGGSDTPSVSQAGKDESRKQSAASSRSTGQEPDKRDHSTAFINTGSIRKVGRHQVMVPRVVRSISVKDLIAVLEREPQMSKSALLYRLYNKVSDEASDE